MSFPNYSDPLVANWSSGRDSITLTPSIFDSALLGTYRPFKVVSNCTVGLYWWTNFSLTLPRNFTILHFEVVQETGSRWLPKCIVGLFMGRISTWRQIRPTKQSQNALWQPSWPGFSRNLKVANSQCKKLQRSRNCLINSAISQNTNPCKGLWMDNKVLSFSVLVMKSDCVSVERETDRFLLRRRLKRLTL